MLNYKQKTMGRQARGFLFCRVNKYNGALGYYIEDITKNKNVVLERISNDLSFEQIKYLLFPLPVSGSVAICHIAGLTPEAPTIEEELLGGK